MNLQLLAISSTLLDDNCRVKSSRVMLRNSGTTLRLGTGNKDIREARPHHVLRLSALAF